MNIEWMTLTEVAQLLGISRQAAHKHLKQGHFGEARRFEHSVHRAGFFYKVERVKVEAYKAQRDTP